MEPISGVVFGVICALVAHSRGRSALGWFFIGLFLSCFGLIILLVIPDMNEVEAQRLEQERVDRELRRLREQVRHERARTDERFGETVRRLDAHDGHMGLDTRFPPPLPGALTALPAGHPLAEVEWWYAHPDEDDYRGPFGNEDFGRLLANGEIEPETLVWCEKLPDWSEAASVPEFAEYFDV